MSSTSVVGTVGAFPWSADSMLADGVFVGTNSSLVAPVTIGEGANIGAGTIFANYDGVTKGHTNIGPGAFVGSNSVIVAPRSIGDGAYIAAGSAVINDVEPGQLAVTRAQQRNIDGWVARRFAGTKMADAARAAAETKGDE